MYIELRKNNLRVYINESDIGTIFDERKSNNECRIKIVTKTGLEFEKVITTNYELAKWNDFVDGLNMVSLPITF